MVESMETMRCPQCQALMQSGFLSVSHGMHFIRGDGKGASHFAEDLPGTHAIMRANRLPAWRCKACDLVTFRFGRDIARAVERMTRDDRQADTEGSDAVDA